MADKGDWVGTVSVGRVLEEFFADSRPDAWCWQSISSALLDNADENFDVWLHAEQMLLFDLMKRPVAMPHSFQHVDHQLRYRTVRISPARMRAIDPFNEWPEHIHVSFGIREVIPDGQVRGEHDRRRSQVPG
jgi:hypothetical protein